MACFPHYAVLSLALVVHRGYAVAAVEQPETTTTATTTSTTIITPTSTRFIGDTTTTTMTTDNGSCLKSRGHGQLLHVLPDHGNSSCAKFSIQGTLFRSVDVSGSCMDWFANHGWGLWDCHGKQNQQLESIGSGKWCYNENCILVSGDASATVTIAATNNRPWRRVLSGQYNLPGGYHCGKAGRTFIMYPSDVQNGPFPIASFGHGMGGGVIHKLCEDIVRMGFVVVAPLTGSCDGHGGDILDAISRSKSDRPLHPALAYVDWDRTAIFGHSFGGDHAAGVARWAPGLKAVVVSHSFEYGRNIGRITIPVMCMSGSDDRTANRGMLPQYKMSKAVHKVYAAVQGGRHMEPAQGGRLNKYAAHFLACHVQELQTSCNIVYGNAEDSMCKQIATSICLRSAAPDFSTDPNATTTTHTTTSTTTLTLPPSRFMLRSSGDQDCLVVSGKSWILVPNPGTDPCIKFEALGKQIKSVDMPERCLTVHQKTKQWALWKCKINKDHQRFWNTGSMWCARGRHCVAVHELHEDNSTESTTSTTNEPQTSTTTTVSITNTTTTSIGLTTSTTTLMAITTSSVMGSSIRSGDMIFLRTRAGDGNHVDVEGVSVRARWVSHGQLQALTIEKKNGGTVHSGDVVYLRSHTGENLDVVDGVVQSRWQDRGDWQAMTIEKRIGSGAISPEDVVCFRAHGGKHLDVEDYVVRARFADCGNWQAMKIEVEAVGAVFSGDSIHLLAHTGNRIEVEGTSVHARWSEAGLWQTFTIESYGGRAIFSGDTVFLRAHTGNLLHVQDSAVRAEWNDYGTWQAFIIQKLSGDGPVMPGNSILLRAHTGLFIDVEGAAVQARWWDEGLWQTLVIEKPTQRRLVEVPLQSMSQIILV